MDLLLGGKSLKTVEKIHSSFERLESISLAVAIVLELIGMRRSSNVAWVALVISDAARTLYGRREKTLEKQVAEKAELAHEKLEARVVRRSVSRNLSDEEQKSLIKVLRRHAGQKFTLRASRTRVEANDAKLEETNTEQSFFVMQLRVILSTSGWRSENIANLPDFRVAKGLTIFCGFSEGANRAVSDLALALTTLDIACQVIVQQEDFPVPMIICVGLL